MKDAFLNTMNSVDFIWKTVLGEIETEVSRANFLTLFKHTSLLSLENNIATIAAQSTMIIDLLQKRYYTLIKKAIDKHTGSDSKIILIPKALNGKPHPEKETPLFAALSEETQKPHPAKHPSRVRKDYTFSNLAVSSSNQLAFVSAQAVAKNPGKTYNPLFLYGPVGVGKTHLLHAIANYSFEKSPQQEIVYITSEEFTNEVVDAIRNNETARMKKRFRSAKLLIIDDVQFVEGKERVQEELFHTFNILIDNASQICLSSDRPPHEIKKLEKRLSSRFAGGLTVDIEPPDFELKTAILLIKSKKYDLDLPIAIAKIIAQKAQDSRSLEGLLLRVITSASTRGEEITEYFTRRCLGEEETPVHFHSEDIIRGVCDYFKMKPTLLKGPKRDASIVKARHIAMYLLKNELSLSFVEIGNVLGGRDHTTVMHGVEKIESLYSSNPRLLVDIRGIKKQYGG